MKSREANLPVGAAAAAAAAKNFMTKHRRCDKINRWECPITEYSMGRFRKAFSAYGQKRSLSNCRQDN